MNINQILGKHLGSKEVINTGVNFIDGDYVKPVMESSSTIINIPNNVIRSCKKQLVLIEDIVDANNTRSILEDRYSSLKKIDTDDISILSTISEAKSDLMVQDSIISDHVSTLSEEYDNSLVYSKQETNTIEPNIFRYDSTNPIDVAVKETVENIR